MGAVSFDKQAGWIVMGEKVADVSVASEDRKMSVVADPHAIQHLDALFDVVRVRRSRRRHPSCVVTTTNTELLDALFEVVHSSPESSARGGTAPNAKSWKERELPPSFFDAGSSPEPGMKSPDKYNLPEPPNTQKSPVPSSSQQKSHLQKLSTPLPTLKLLSTSPVAYAVALPLTWSGSKPSDCLTYYIEWVHTALLILYDILHMYVATICIVSTLHMA